MKKSILRFNGFNEFSALLNTKEWFLECFLPVSMDAWVDGMERRTDIGVYVRMYVILTSTWFDEFYLYSVYKSSCIICLYQMNMNILAPLISDPSDQF
jgi:hypothetical protein